MMIADIHGEPIQPTRQHQEARAFHRARVEVPMRVVARIGVLEVVLHREQHDTHPARDRYAQDIDAEKDRRSAHTAHQHPDAQQDEIVPEHVPVLSRRVPIARLIARRMRP